MSDDVLVRAVRTFEGAEGFKTPRSAPFRVGRQRYAELKANGLVVEVKAMPAPDNKIAPEAENKMASEPLKRGSGRVRKG